MDELMLNSEVEMEKTQFIVIRIGDEQYGIDIKYVDNIVRMQKITRVPDVQSYFEGVINLRGEVVPVMNLRKKAGLPDEEYTKDTRIIIIKLENNAPIGIVVDAVKEVVTLTSDEIEYTKGTVRNEQVTFINGIGKCNNSLISLLDLNAVISE
ncbi:MAG: chemotaxis protein CheW [Lachnospiraceae bacterium]|nr:chemotaxis protein CheW [Lachnospiraceae bacterium]